MKKILTLSALCLLFLFQYCGTAKKAQATNAVSYNQDVHPIIMNSCSPCHTGGKQKSLNNYAAASGEIDEILTRIQKIPVKKVSCLSATTNCLIPPLPYLCAGKKPVRRKVIEMLTYFQ